MNIEIRNIITKVVSEFWKPYEELEVKIQKLLIKKKYTCKFCFCSRRYNQYVCIYSEKR